MSTNYLSKHTLGLTQLQSGQGSPTHSAKKGSLYIDVSTSDYYKNTDGNTTWSLLITSGSTSVDTYVTGFTYNDSNKLTLSQNQGQSDINVYLNQFSGLTVNGSVSATTFYGDGQYLTGIVSTDNYVTGGTFSGTTLILYRQNGFVTITGFSSNVDIVCNSTTTTTSGLEFKKIQSITGFTTGSYILKSYVTAYSGSSKYGFWERTLGVTTNGSTPINVIVTNDFDKYYSAFTPTHIVYTPTVSNTVDVYISGVTNENLNWFSYYNLIGQECGFSFGGSTIINNNGGGTFTGNTSATCISDIYVSDIHSCSPLNINPNDEGEVIFGSNNTLYVDLPNNKIGIGKVPSYDFDVDGTLNAGSINVAGQNISNDISTIQDDLSYKLDTSVYNDHVDINISRNPHYTRFIDLNGGTAHTHTISDITDLQSSLDSKTDLTLFNLHTGNTNNPHQTTFYNLVSTAHTHTISDINDLSNQLISKLNTAGGTITGDLTVNGGFTVIGTATTINTETISVSDNIITLNSNLSGGTPFLGDSGIVISRGSGTTSNLLWNESNGYWVAGFSGSTKRILVQGDNLSLLSSAHTHSISDIINLQTSLNNKFDKSGGTITGSVYLTTLTADTVYGTSISGVTFYGDGSKLNGVRFTGGTVEGSSNFTNSLSANSLYVTSEIKYGVLSNPTGGTRMVETDSSGVVSANRTIISAYITDGTIIGYLENTSNWGNKNYTGTTITGTYQGQKHYNSDYFFEAVNNNVWIRLSRV
jgi:hypothetical protein